MKLILLVLIPFFVLSSITTQATAAEDYGTALAVKKHTDQYMVSAVLKLNGTEPTIRLVHMIEKADNQDQAIGMAFVKIRSDFSNYSVLDSIASKINKEEASSCIYL
ncbi:hypothetical protein [Methylotenera sp.]|uniref:hypothetical protein n=1 Tax=Methylotenera sp. TaxID=2051956 RepID=UPI00248A8A8A|nr:hypothetical protein [Methylotenera sp.]MDI1298635.1 hypothetical protein [Methylotenera sp.]